MTSLGERLGERVYLDANIFIYALEAFERLEAQIRTLFATIEAAGAAVVTSEITLAEVLPGALRTGREDLVAAYRAMLEDAELVHLAPVDRSTILLAASFRAGSRLHTVDSLHIATARLQNCTAFVTNDRRLATVAGVTAILLERDVVPA